MGTIQSSVNQTLAIAGALASQVPSVKQGQELKLEEKNFQKLDKAIKQIEKEYSTATRSEKIQLTKMKKEFAEKSSESLGRMKDISLQKGDVDDVRRYNQLIKENAPRLRTKVKTAQKSLESEQLMKRAQSDALKKSIAEIRKTNLQHDIAKKQDILKGKEGMNG